jgi:anaphase-promoting complex subunit 6
MRVLQVSPHNDEALAFLGIVSHLQGDVDGAILKYHEVRCFQVVRQAS